MHVAPAKAKPDGRKDDGQSDPNVALCFADATKTLISYIFESLKCTCNTPRNYELSLIYELAKLAGIGKSEEILLKLHGRLLQ